MNTRIKKIQGAKIYLLSQTHPQIINEANQRFNANDLKKGYLGHFHEVFLRNKQSIHQTNMKAALV